MRKIYKLFLMLVLGIFAFTDSSFGQNRYAIGLDGGESMYIKEDGSNHSIDVTSAWTFEAWINVASYSSGDYDCIMDRRGVFSFYLIDDDDKDYAVAFAARNSSDNVIAYIDCDGTGSTSADMEYNIWYHVAATFDGTTAKLFINDTEYDSDTDTDFNLTADSDPINIGGRYWGSYSRQMSDAQIDEVRVSKIARSISDMQTSTHWEEYSSDANTIILMHLDDQADPPSYLSGTGFDGTSKDDDITTIDYTSSKIDSPYYLLRPKYRSAQTGSWDDASQWEVENGADNYVSATLYPDQYAQKVIIQDGHSITADNVTIKSDSELEITGNLTVTTSLTNNGVSTNLVVKSTATEQGSLIHSTASVAATVERYISNYTAADDGWHLLSSPVDNMAIAGSDFVPVSGTEDLFYWDESQGTIGKWINYHADGGGFGFTNFTNGQGYLCAYDALDETKEFQGNLNVTDVTRGSFTNVNPDPWELVGNPFSSAIDWTAGTWTKNGIGLNAKVYNVDAGNYQTKTIIPSTQGFIVEITNSTNQLTIPANARVHDGQDWYKNEETNENTLELKLSGGDNSFYDITQIIFTEGATLEFDDQFDGHKFYGVPSAPQMYTTSPSMEKLTDNHIPDSPNEILVPLNIEVASDGDYTLDVEFNTINSQKNTYLEDLITGELINLATQDTYTFQASKDDAPNRFLLHFNSTTGIEESVNQESVHIYSYNHQIYIQSEEVLDGQVNIYDLSGKLIQTKTINDSGLESMSIHQAAGVYFVEFISKQKTYKEKVIIR